MKEAFGIIAAVIAFFAYIPYIREIIRGDSKPKQATWLIWTILGLTYTVSAIIEGGAAILFVGADSIAQGSVFLAALYYGTGKFTNSDKLALIVAGIAFFGLLITSNVLFSLLIALFIDGLGSVITMIHMRKDPTIESSIFWGLYFWASIFALLSIESYNFNNLAFPTYVLLVSLFFAIYSKPNFTDYLKNRKKSS